MKAKLKNEEELQWSPIVANNSMNRKRKAIGVNSYEQDIKFNPIKYLSDKIDNPSQGNYSWLDLCCGEGNALIQTAKHFYHLNQTDKLNLTGIDLVNYFNPIDPFLNNILTFKEQNLSEWITTSKYDLITIVHGLHYIGDKIGLIRKIGGALKPDGLMIGNLDLNNIKITGAKKGNKLLKEYFDDNGISYNSKTKIITIRGNQSIAPKFKYLGADDTAGPNYTGQDVVDSFYLDF